MTQAKSITFIELTSQSPEFDAAYAVFCLDISPAFVEAKEFLRNRLRVRDTGPQTEQEQRLVQDGYTLHLIAAKHDDKVIGAVYGHLISKIGVDGRAIGFVTYVAVLPEYRRQGIGATLLAELKRKVEADSVRITSRPLLGMVFEIEKEGRKGIKGLVRSLHGWPLDIAYWQPALHVGARPEPMQLWFQPLEPLVARDEDAAKITFPAELIESMVRNLLVMEYVGPDGQGFDLTSGPFSEFLQSIRGRSQIGFGVDT